MSVTGVSGASGDGYVDDVDNVDVVEADAGTDATSPDTPTDTTATDPDAVLPTSETAHTDPTGAAMLEDSLNPDGAEAGEAPAEAEDFDLWAMDPEVQSRMQALTEATTEDEVTALRQELISDYNVPSDVVDAVITGSTNFGGHLRELVTEGELDAVRLNDDGSARVGYGVDSDGVHLDTPRVAIDAGSDGVNVAGQDDSWEVGVSPHGQGAEVAVGWKGEHADHDVSAAVSGSDDGTVTVETGAEVSWEGDEADHNVTGDVSVGTDGNVEVGGSYTRTTDELMQQGDGRVRVGADGGVEVDGSYTHTTDERVQRGEGGVEHNDGTVTVSGGYETREQEGESSTSVSGTVSAGTTTGASGNVDVNREDIGVNVSGSRSTTTLDEGVEDSGAAAISIRTDGETDDGGEYTVEVGVRGSVTDNTATGRSTTSAGGSLGVDFEGGSVEGTVNRRITDTPDEHNVVDTVGVDVTRTTTSETADGEEQTNTLSVNADAAVYSDPDEVDSVSLGVESTRTSGEGDDAQRSSVRVEVGRDDAGAVVSGAGLTGDMVEDGEQATVYASVEAERSVGDTRIAGTLNAGVSEDGDLVVASAEGEVDFSENAKLDVFAGVAAENGTASALLSTTEEFVFNNGIELEVGGQLQLVPGDEGYDALWSAYAALGVPLREDMTLTLKMGVTGEGQEITYVPEVMFEIPDQLEAHVIGNFGPEVDPTVVGRLDLGRLGLSIYGGYGDPAAGANPYAGNPGVSIPAFDSGNSLGTEFGNQGFIGVQTDLIQLGRSLGIGGRRDR